VEYLAGARKTYRAQVELGACTDTYDASGKVLHTGDPSSVTRAQVELALQSFLGSVEQIPPMHSAIKHEGKRLYELARAGIEVTRKPREVTFYRLDLLEWQSPVVSIEAECSAGTYIRSLAQDIGTALGCGAHLKSLVRVESQPFHIDEAVPLDRIEQAASPADWQCHLHPIDEVLAGWEATVLTPENEARVLNGCSITVEGRESAAAASEHCRAYSGDGRFLAILRQEQTGLWHPDKVFRS